MKFYTGTHKAHHAQQLKDEYECPDCWGEGFTTFTIREAVEEYNGN